MNQKAKKVLTDQGSSVAQAMKWVGGAIFGDPDEVLDDMVERAEEQERGKDRKTARAIEAARARRQRRAPPPPPEVIDVDGFIDDEDDDER